MNTHTDTKKSLRILQVSPQDTAGGAERLALDLHQQYLRQSIDARLLVRFNRKRMPGVFEADVYKGASLWSAGLGFIDRYIARRPHFPGRDSFRLLLGKLAVPLRWHSQWSGRDDFNYPYSRQLLQEPDWRPDIIHLHNLHGSYFDLRALPTLARSVPVIWTLHDTWSFTGHCAYFIDCDRWHHGCGNCPDLSRPPSIHRDRSSENWSFKRDIYMQSHIHLVCPSNWMKKQIQKSMLNHATIHVLPYGVDLNVFRAGDKQIARNKLGLPMHTFICLFVSVSGASSNPYKDYSTVHGAIARLLRQVTPGSVQLICLGGKGKLSTSLQPFQLTPGYISNSSEVAAYYQAADVYLHAAHVDNFPYAALEAQACGLPVIATAVGGIPEQVEDGVTGYLLPRGDSQVMAEKIAALMGNRELLNQMGQQAVRRASLFYDLEQQVEAYLKLYHEVLAKHKHDNCGT